MARWKVIVNRAAGRVPVSLDAVRSVLQSAGVEADIEAPASVSEAEETIRSLALEGVDHFAFVGGDGSLSMAANVLLRIDGLEPPVVALLPSGTGCDLLRTFAIPTDLAGAAAHLTTDTVYPIDVGVLEGSWGTRYFVNVAQIGVGAAAAQTASRITRRLGPSRYPMAFAARLPGFPAAHVTITTERRTYQSRALAVIMANAQYFAGGWNVAPRATLMDGVLDVQIIDTPKRRAPALVPKVIKGTHLMDRAVRRFSSGSFTVETDVPWPVEADGDMVGNTPLSSRVVPAALRLKI